MRILYCQKMLFPNRSAHAIHTGLTAASLAMAGGEVLLFPGTPFADRDRVIGEFFAQLGFDELPDSLSCNSIPTRHKGLYGLFFRWLILRELRRAPFLCWASSVKEAAMALTLRPKKQNPVPVVFEAHHLISRLKEGKQAERLYALEKNVFSQADMVVFNSKTLHDEATGYLPKPRRSLVSPIGYNERAIRAIRCLNQLEPSEKSRTVHLAYVGSLQEGKGVENLVHALSRLPENYALTIIGAGKETRIQAVRDLADKKGLTPRITFTGWVEQRAITPLLENCDVFVIPTSSDKDFFAPIKMYEALGFGLPIIATPTASLKYGLKDGENALFASGPGAEALASAIKRLGDDTRLRQSMRRANLAAAERLTVSHRARELLRIFAQEFTSPHTPGALRHTDSPDDLPPNTSHRTHYNTLKTWY